MVQVLKPQVRAALLREGLEVFAEHGYRDATMGAIAQAAGVAAPSIYRYYPTKAALFEAVIPQQLIAEHDRLLDARVDALTRVVRPQEPAEQLLDFWIEHRLAVAILLDHLGPTSRSYYATAFVDRLVSQVEATLEQDLDALHRQLLTLVFDNTRRAIAVILRSSADPVYLREAITAFWSYQLPGLDSLIDRIRDRSCGTGTELVG